MGKKKYDFAGWVTVNDTVCSDGVIIKHDAFKANHKAKVPLVWNHSRNDPSNVLGYVELEHKDKGTYGYGYFNNTQKALDAKESVRHGDIVAMSIAANEIRKTGQNVIHGSIYEVSLVLKGANPGALITDVLTHSAESNDSVVIYTDNIIHAYEYDEDDDELKHDGESSESSSTGDGATEASEGTKVTNETDTNDSKDETEKKEVEESKDDSDDIDASEALEEVFSKLDATDLGVIMDFAMSLAPEGTEPEKVFEVLSDDAIEKVMDLVFDTVSKKESNEESDDENDEKDSSKEIQNDEDEEKDTNMKKNQFSEKANGVDVQHAQLCLDILNDAERHGSLRQSMIAHGVEATIDDLMHGVTSYGDELQHSISTINDLITVETFDGAPELIRPEKQSVVDKILAGVKSTPKHTVRGRFADLTTEEARAKGYIKGNEKLEEVFGTLDRVTYPQTIYKKQSIDNDDLIDIDWDIVAFMRAEMREMWRYEVARAIFVSDGRQASAADKIKETSVRPIVKDDKFYAPKVYSVTAANFIDSVILNVTDQWDGTGTPDLYVDKTLLAQVRLAKGTDGHYLFGNRPATKSEIADILGVNEIVEPDFLNHTGMAVVVNLKDYEVASPNKGKSQSYEDFDIDYNKHKYLLEGRLAGALVTPKSALVFLPTEDPEA